MEPTRNNNSKCLDDKSIADVLCSAGYLPPRNVQDIERFERIYAGRSFETEGYSIDTDAIFDRVRGVSSARNRKVRPMTTIYNRPGMLRVAETVSKVQNDSVADEIRNLLKDKKD